MVNRANEIENANKDIKSKMSTLKKLYLVLKVPSKERANTKQIADKVKGMLD